MAVVHVQAVAKAAAILVAFDYDHRIMTVREITLRTGIPRTTAHAILQTLVAAGLLDQRSGGGFQLGDALSKLGGQVIERQGLADKALIPIERHLAKFDLEVHVAVHLPGSIVYVHRGHASATVPTVNRTGRSWAIHASACGRAILAALSPAAREAEITPQLSQQERNELEDEFEQFAADGYLVTNVSQSGMTSVAAPVIDRTGLPIGAIGCANFSKYMTYREIRALGQALRSASEDTERRLGR